MVGYPQLHSLNPEGIVIRDNKGSHEVSEDKRLELRLGPPGEDQPLVSHGAKRGYQDIIEAKTEESNWLTNSSEKQAHNNNLSFSEKPVDKVFSYPWSCGPLISPFPSSSSCQQPKPSFLQYPLISNSMAAMGEDSSQPCNSRVTDLQCPEKKAYSTPANCAADTVVPNSSQKRIALPPVVGWPPVRSFRKNLATSSSSKLVPESSNKITKEESGTGKSENLGKCSFVKINMDGVPIGRKVDLKAYDNYEKLSLAVDELFRDLLAAQGDFSAALNENEMEKTEAITGLLDGSGEYDLVYEDNEGDRMLVGDVPWHMFISSAKRLRVLKKSELSALHLSGSKLSKTPLDSAVKIRCTY